MVLPKDSNPSSPENIEFNPPASGLALRGRRQAVVPRACCSFFARMSVIPTRLSQGTWYLYLSCIEISCLIMKGKTSVWKLNRLIFL